MAFSRETTGAPWTSWPILRGSTSTNAATSEPWTWSSRAKDFPTGPAPQTTTLAKRRRRVAQVVHLAANEGLERVRRIRARAARAMLAPAEHRRLHVPEERPGGPEAQDEVVVLGPAPVAVAAHGSEHVRPHRQRRVRQRALDEDVARGRLNGDEAVQPALVAAGTVSHGLLGEVGHPASAGGERAVGERVDLRGQALGERDVVAVHARDQPPRRGPRPLERGDDADGLLQDDAETAVVARVRVRDLRRAVGRAVVDDQHLEFGERLRGERVKGIGEICGLVAHGQQNRDERLTLRLLDTWIHVYEPL